MEDENHGELRSKLAEAQSIIDALRTGRVDAVVGETEVLLLRLQEVEDALRKSEARYRGIVEDQADLVFRWDPQGTLTFVNEAFCRLFQRPRDELVGSPVDAYLPDDSAAADLRRMLASRSPGEHHLECEHAVQSPGQGNRWLQSTHRPIRGSDGAVVEIQSVAHDITERKRAEKKLEQVNVELEARVEERTRQLRTMVRELDEAEQRERGRLADFLHDDLQQLLVASKLSIDSAQRKAIDEGQREALERTNQLLDRSISASRSLASQLSPPILRKRGLIAALSWLAREMQDMHELVVEVDADSAAEPEASHVRDLLFAFARELLLNVVKHARATSCELTVKRVDDRQMELSVRDYGVGFDAPEGSTTLSEAGGVGLRGIAERLQALGGELRIDSRPGEGCRVALKGPLYEG